MTLSILYGALSRETERRSPKGPDSSVESDKKYPDQALVTLRPPHAHPLHGQGPLQHKMELPRDDLEWRVDLP